MAILSRRETRTIVNIFYFLLVLATWIFVILAGIAQSQRFLASNIEN